MRLGVVLSRLHCHKDEYKTFHAQTAKSLLIKLVKLFRITSVISFDLYASEGLYIMIVYVLSIPKCPSTQSSIPPAYKAAK